MKRWLLVTLLLLPSILAAAERPLALLGLNSAQPDTLAARIDLALRLKREDPEAAGRALDAILEQVDSLAQAHGLGDAAAARLEAETQRLVQRARMQFLVEAGDRAGLARALQALPVPADPNSARAADRLLIEAELAELDHERGAAAQSAQAALEVFRSRCPSAAALRVAALAQEPEQAEPAMPPATLVAYPHCDYRGAWQALRILERQSLARGVPARARSEIQAALDLAAAAGDPLRAALSWSLLAHVSTRAGDPLAIADQHSQRARALAQPLDAADLDLRLLINEATIAGLRGESDIALLRTRSALALARSAGLRRMQARLLNNIADAHLRRGQPRRALASVAEALPLAQEFEDRGALRALASNAGLAHIALGQLEQGKQLLAQADAGYGEPGGEGERAMMLREYGEALARAGDAEAALALYHRERELSAAHSRENLAVALREIQAGFEAELRQRDLSMLQQQLDTRTAELASHDLLLRIGLLLLAVLALLLLGGALVHRRLRGRERALHARRRRLSEESERDPLTGLGNRRAMVSRMEVLGAPELPTAALLLLDVDEFKKINDRHGHAVGDDVLKEIARRLASAIRREDQLVRWGGEEFLIHAPEVSAEAALVLARRVLERVAATPILTAVGELRVSASIGLCLTRLHPGEPAMAWEAALRLADLALYAAKSRGRDRCVAVLACAEIGADALARAEADFELAERSGLLRVGSVVGAHHG
jgi:diguanylate cyclase (GGDEF)-like protein